MDVSGQHHALDAVPQGRNPLSKKLGGEGGGQSRSGRFGEKENQSHLMGVGTPNVHPVALSLYY